MDVAAYDYVAPPDARLSAVPIPDSAVSDLWPMADWIEAQGFRIDTRSPEALPSSR